MSSNFAKARHTSITKNEGFGKLNFFLLWESYETQKKNKVCVDKMQTFWKLSCVVHVVKA